MQLNPATSTCVSLPAGGRVWPPKWPREGPRGSHGWAGGTGTQQLQGWDKQAHPQPGGAGSFPPSPPNSPERPSELLGKSMAKFFFFLSCQSPKCLIPPRSRNQFLPLWFQGSLGMGASGRRLPCETLRNTKSFPWRCIGKGSQNKEGQNDGVDRQRASCAPDFATASHTPYPSGSSVLDVTSNVGDKSLECRLALLAHGHPVSCPGLSWRRGPGQKAPCFPQ